MKDYWTRAFGGATGWNVRDADGQPFSNADAFWKHARARRLHPRHGSSRRWSSDTVQAAAAAAAAPQSRRHVPPRHRSGAAAAPHAARSRTAPPRSAGAARRAPARDARASRSSSGPIPHVWDGRFANNGWLQELPKPLTKVTWDTVGVDQPAGSPRQHELDERRRHRAALPRHDRRGCRSAIVPGQPRRIGHGASSATAAAWPAASATPPRRRSSSTPTCCARRTRRGSARGLEIAKTGERYLLATTQDHHAMEGRAPGPRRRRSRSTRTNRRSSHAHGPHAAEDADAVPRARIQRQQVGHGDRPDVVHRLQRLRRRLRRREQHPGRRQGAGRAQTARCTGSASTTTSQGDSDSADGQLPPAGAVHAVRERAVRGGLPGRRDRRTAPKA